MFSFVRSAVLIAALALSVFADPLNVRQDQNQGQPIASGVGPFHTFVPTSYLTKCPFLDPC
jgi:hypothetical protein